MALSQWPLLLEYPCSIINTNSFLLGPEGFFGPWPTWVRGVASNPFTRDVVMVTGRGRLGGHFRALYSGVGNDHPLASWAALWWTGNALKYQYRKNGTGALPLYLRCSRVFVVVLPGFPG